MGKEVDEGLKRSEIKEEKKKKIEEERQERERAVTRRKEERFFSLKQEVVGRKACDWRRD